MSKSAPEASAAGDWIKVCNQSDLTRDGGVCALVGNRQVAIFYLSAAEQVYGLANHDPFSAANVISRGIVGSIEGRPVVASPIYKQHFDLETGDCLEEPGQGLGVYQVRINEGQVQVLANRPESIPDSP